MYRGDPTLTFGIEQIVDGVVANPKSAIFEMFDFDIRMFAGLRSL
jgi:hypothetical protein